MARGPAKKPTALKMVKGEKKSRINHKEPKPGAGDVVVPAWLGPEELEVWNRLAPDLTKKGVLTAWDVDSFAAFCNAVVVHRAAAASVAENGTTTMTVYRVLDSGDVLVRESKNPDWSVARESAQLIVTLGGRFGLNPSDRSNIVVGSGDEAGDGKDPARLLGS